MRKSETRGEIWGMWGHVGYGSGGGPHLAEVGDAVPEVLGLLLDLLGLQRLQRVELLARVERRLLRVLPLERRVLEQLKGEEGRRR